jgi:hypothetical protein
MQRYAATSGIPDALLSCHRCDEILPPGATQSCHLNGSGLERQIQRSAAEWRLRSEQQAVRRGLPVNQEELGSHTAEARSLPKCRLALRLVGINGRDHANVIYH